jgi:hypothetical protein
VFSVLSGGTGVEGATGDRTGLNTPDTERDVTLDGGAVQHPDDLEMTEIG